MRLPFWLGLVLTALPAVARAESTDPASADALFRAGREAAEQGDPQTACARFEESYRLDAAAGTLVNLGLCEEALNRLARAWEHFRRAADALEPQDERQSLVREHLAALEPRVPQLTLSLKPEAKEGVEVRRDGVLMTRASFGVPLPVDPGPHEVVVGAAGHELRRYALSLSVGQHLAVVLEPGAELAPPSKPAATLAPPTQNQSRESERTARRTWAYAAVASGGLDLVAGGVLGAFYLHERGIVDDHCPGKRCDPTGMRAVGAADVLQTVCFVALGLGIASAATGAGLMLTEAPEPTPSRAPLSAKRGLLVEWRRRF